MGITVCSVSATMFELYSMTHHGNDGMTETVTRHMQEA